MEVPSNPNHSVIIFLSVNEGTIVFYNCGSFIDMAEREICNFGLPGII